MDHLRTLLDAGVAIADHGVSGPRRPAPGIGVGEVVVDGEVTRREAVVARAVVLRRDGLGKRFDCDLLVLSLGLSPRDGLARMALPGEPVTVVGDAALASGASRPCGRDGTVCLCEDVSMHDLEQAWDEGYRNTEILKRYTTATMGPCQGAMCGRALSCFAASRGEVADADETPAPRTTARPPARPVSLESLAAGVHEIVDKRTSLHELHVAAGARLDRSGGWLRPFTYGDWREEYRAVRERVSLMDVGTLGKFTIAGPDADELVDRLVPCRTDDLEPGRTRYVLTLDDAGYVMDDGLLARVGDEEWYLSSTSGGAGRTEARLRNLIDRLDLDVHPLDRTAQWGAINVAGPHARDLLERLTDDAIDRGGRALPRVRRHRGRGRALPGDPHGVRRGARVRAASPGRRRPRALDRARETGARVGSAPARARRTRAAAAREGPRLPGPGHDARRHAGETRHGVGGRHVEAVVRRQTCSRAHGRAADVATPRRPRVHRRADGHHGAARRAADRGRRGRRAHHLGGALPRARPRDRSRVGARGRRRVPRSAPGPGRERPRPWCRRRSTTRTADGCVAELRVELPSVVAVLAPSDVCDLVVAPDDGLTAPRRPERSCSSACPTHRRFGPWPRRRALVEDVSDAWVSFVLEGPTPQRRSLGSRSWSCRRSAGSRVRSPTPPRRCSSSPTSSRSSSRRWWRPTSSTVSAPMRRRCSTRERPVEAPSSSRSAICGRVTTS